MDQQTQLPLPYIWYPFDTLSSTTVENSGSAGTKLNASLYNGAAVVQNDKPEGTTALVLNNSPNKPSQDNTGQYLSIPSFNLGSSFTISLWFKKSSPSPNFLRIFDFSDGKNVINTFVLTFYNGNLLIPLNNNNYIVSSTNYCDNAWHHIVLIQYTSNFYVYIDTLLITTISASSGVQVYRTNNYIGRSSFQNDYYATISICDFRIYTMSLTANDVDVLFNYYKILNFSNYTSIDKTDPLNDKIDVFYQLYEQERDNKVLHYSIIIGLPIFLFIVISLILYFT